MTQSEPGLEDRKAALRTALRSGRRARPPAERAAVAAALARAALTAPALAALPRGSTVAAYASTPTEPGTAALRAALAAAGLVVLLPVVAPLPGPLGWVLDGAGPAPAPAPAPAGIADAAVVLLPALAVDAAGTRLGQGGGHYDRSLAALAGADPGPELSPARRPVLAAVVHPEEVLPAGALPRGPHDVPVDAVLTPDGWTWLGPPPHEP